VRYIFGLQDFLLYLTKPTLGKTALKVIYNSNTRSLRWAQDRRMEDGGVFYIPFICQRGYVSTSPNVLRYELETASDLYSDPASKCPSRLSNLGSRDSCGGRYRWRLQIPQHHCRDRHGMDKHFCSLSRAAILDFMNRIDHGVISVRNRYFIILLSSLFSEGAPNLLMFVPSRSIIARRTRPSTTRNAELV